MSRRVFCSLVLVFTLACRSSDEASVTIYRDAHGVPHVYGRTDADAAFGFAYAQAEDNFWQVEDNYIRALGRASEVYGEETLFDDWLNRALEIPRLSREEYAQSDARLRALLDAYAAGFNHFLASHPEVEPRLIDRFEPWYPLALIRYLYYQRGFAGSAGALRGEAVDVMEASLAVTLESMPSPEEALLPRSEQGSNSWAVTPARSASGHALLFINPHLPFFGPSQVYEGHVMSGEGWNFTGYTRFGFPMPYVGFNEDLGWASTDNAADLADLYFETFDHPDDSLAYRYGDAYRTAVAWTDTIRVAVGDGLEARVARLRKTHHGPIVAERGGRPMALRMARFEEPGWLDQWYAMTRARTYEAFMEAVGRLDMLFGNYLYADRAGNIFYAYNAAVPRRDGRFDWSGPVDGSDPATEWQGYHPMSEIPQVLNPPSGFLQNCNGTPFLATAEGNPDPDDFPSYMVREGDNARSKAARRILTAHASFSFEEWARLSYDTYVVSADENVPALVTAWEEARAGNRRSARRTADAVALLRDWDQVSTVDSEAMTLYVYYGEALFAGGRPLDVLERAVAKLEQDWDSWRVPWGEVNRLQRVHSSGTGFDDAAPSLPVAGVPSWAGSMFTFWAQPQEGTRRRYGVGGNSYVAVVEFGPQVRARSLHPFGYHADQSPRYVAGDYKPAWLTLDDVRANTVSQWSIVNSSTVNGQ